MYSVVLVVALAGGAEAPDCHRGGCQGGGCVGGGCYGGGHGHRHGGGGCCGCYGGSVSYGCYGGGYGGGCYGGFGGGYGGGCYGGGYGGGGYGGGCYGGGYGGGYYGGGYGGGMGMGGYYGGYPMYQGNPKGMPGAEKIGDPKEKKSEEINVPAPGTLVVNLPANAKLSIDGYVSQQTSSQRRLVTTPINPGQEFTYTLVAEVNGAQQSQVVTVRAGEEVPVSFNFSTAVPVSTRR